MSKTIFSLSVALLLAASLFGGEITPDEIAALEAAEQMIPVRPGNPDKGVPFWTWRASAFRRPPNFNFDAVVGAAAYEYIVIDAQHGRHTFTTNIPYASLAPVWAELPTGPVTVFCEGKDATGHTCGRAGFKRFPKLAHFTGDYPRPSRSYAEAARLAYRYIASTTNLTALTDLGSVDATSWLYRAYPAKMRGAAVDAMVRYAAREPAQRERALRIARTEADFLIERSAKPGTPLAGFPLTYSTEKYADEPGAATKYRGQSMSIYPAEAGGSYLALWRATGEAKYLAAAKAIGETYLKRQLDSGTWYLREKFETGERVSDNLLVPTAVISFLLDLNRATGDGRYLDAADRAFAYIERGPLKTFDWEGQFEDVAPSKPYGNMTIHMSCDTALFLLDRYPGDAKRIAQAREIMRLAEDQFVHWEKPRFDWMPKPDARYPAAFEQWVCFTPIDSSAAKAILAYVALYKAEHKLLDLLKARALADSIVAVQDPDGRIPTWWEENYVHDRNADWLNCMAGTVRALEVIAALDGAYRADRAPLRVLMIGNSFSEQMMRAMPPIAYDMGLRLDICSLYIGGCTLERHMANVRAPETKPYNVRRNRFGERLPMVKGNIPEMLKDTKWDVVTVQQASHESWIEDSYYPHGDDLVRIVRELAPQAKIYVQETWSYTPFDKRLGEWGLTQDAMYEKLHAAYGKFAAKHGLEIIPTGTAVQRWRRELPVKYGENDVGGDVVGSPEWDEYFHMNHMGNHFQALVWTAKLFDVDVTACKYVPNVKGLTPERARMMRKIAQQAVR